MMDGEERGALLTVAAYTRADTGTYIRPGADKACKARNRKRTPVEEGALGCMTEFKRTGREVRNGVTPSRGRKASEGRPGAAARSIGRERKAHEGNKTNDFASDNGTRETRKEKNAQGDCVLTYWPGSDIGIRRRVIWWRRRLAQASYARLCAVDEGGGMRGEGDGAYASAHGDCSGVRVALARATDRRRGRRRRGERARLRLCVRPAIEEQEDDLPDFEDFDVVEQEQKDGPSPALSSGRCRTARVEGWHAACKRGHKDEREVKEREGDTRLFSVFLGWSDDVRVRGALLAAARLARGRGSRGADRCWIFASYSLASIGVSMLRLKLRARAWTFKSQGVASFGKGFMDNVAVPQR
ncbi:hypothetical protein DFH06DRAFT_1122764 [Mycena polygramma]|nr:hypothetical protein DFH06DRAFT_1122764 [Mycena polygramma]